MRKLNEDKYSFSDLLSQNQRDAGYSIIGRDHGTKMVIELRHNRKRVGGTWAYHRITKHTTSVWEPHSGIEYKYQGKGFGKLLYRALFQMLEHYHYHRIAGFQHTVDAHRVHKALRRDLGIKYNCRQLKKPKYISGFKCTYSKYNIVL